MMDNVGGDNHPSSRSDNNPVIEAENERNTVDDESLVKWCQSLQEKALRQEMKTEKYGITNAERAYFRQLFGYDKADVGKRKNPLDAGGYTIEALNLHQESVEEEKQTQHDNEMGVTDIDKKHDNQKRHDLGRLPSIFSQVNWGSIDGSLNLNAISHFPERTCKENGKICDILFLFCTGGE